MCRAPGDAVRAGVTCPLTPNRHTCGHSADGCKSGPAALRQGGGLPGAFSCPDETSHRHRPPLLPRRHSWRTRCTTSVRLFGSGGDPVTTVTSQRSARKRRQGSRGSPRSSCATRTGAGSRSSP